jgi:hypothetical protein
MPSLNERQLLLFQFCPIRQVRLKTVHPRTAANRSHQKEGQERKDNTLRVGLRKL